MSKAFIASVIQDSAALTGVAANRAASDLIDAIVKEMKKSGGFTLPSFGTFRVVKTKARKGLNPIGVKLPLDPTRRGTILGADAEHSISSGGPV